MMSINLSNHDKELIRVIDSQVELLVEKKAPEHVIIDALFDFIPEVQCMVNGSCEKQLDLYYKEYQSFDYFVQLVNQLVHSNKMYT